jgi:hypothetical protein
MSKIKIDLSDPDDRAVWAAALDAKQEVCRFAGPAWKRGDVPNDFDVDAPSGADVTAPDLARQRAKTRTIPPEVLAPLLEACR